MSVISSASSTSTLASYQKLMASRSAAVGGTQGPSQDGNGPPDFTAKFDSALEAQGISGTKLSDLRSQIQQAVDDAKSKADGTTDPRQTIRSAVDGVLKNNGVDVAQFESAVKPKGGHHHHGGADADHSDASPSTDPSTAAAGSASTSASQFDAFLQSKGIDPSQFKSSLMSTIDSGSTDFSSAFAGANSGSDVDMYA